MNYNVGKQHPKFKDLTGQQFGQLKLLDYVKVKNIYVWKCKCSCGNITYTRTKEFLKQKPVNSCANCGRKRMGITNIVPDNGSLKNRLYRNYKKGAINRNYSFELTFEQVLDIISKNCYYCNSIPKEMTGDKNQNSTNTPFLRNGIDRVNNNIGYTLNNVVPCCDLCNRMKMDIDINIFKEHIVKCYNNLNK